jgi:hypothetical protein
MVNITSDTVPGVLDNDELATRLVLRRFWVEIAAQCRVHWSTSSRTSRQRRAARHDGGCRRCGALADQAARLGSKQEADGTDRVAAAVEIGVAA